MLRHGVGSKHRGSRKPRGPQTASLHTSDLRVGTGPVLLHAWQKRNEDCCAAGTVTHSQHIVVEVRSRSQSVVVDYRSVEYNIVVR